MRLSTGITLAASLASLASLCVLLAHGLAALEGPVRVQLPAGRIDLGGDDLTLPMDTSTGRPVVDVMLEGKGPFKMILDTGAMGTVISQGLADELKLRVVGDAQIGSPAGPGTVAGKLVMIGRMGLGAASMTDLHAVSFDMPSLTAGQDAPRGVISAALFAGYLVTFDYPRDRVVVRPGELPPADGSDSFEYDASDPLPTLPVTIAGVGVTVHLDTGSPAGLTLPKTLIEKLPLASKPQEVGRMRTAGSDLMVVGAPLTGTVKVGRYAFENPDLRFIESKDANIGGEMLRRFALTLDVRNRRVHLEEPKEGSAGGTPPPRRYGMQVRVTDEGKLQVYRVDPDSPAEKAGLRSGDLVLRINDEPIEQLDPARLAVTMRAPVLRLRIEREGKTLEFRMNLE